MEGPAPGVMDAARNMAVAGVDILVVASSSPAVTDGMDAIDGFAW